MKRNLLFQPVQILLSLIIMNMSPLCFGHAGGVDDNGGHTNRNTADYHCHRDPCVDHDGEVGNTSSEGPAASTITAENTEAQEALQQLTTLQARIETIPQGFPAYDRGLFIHWSDLDGDCEDSRAEVLLDTSLIPVDYDSGNRCRVDTGYWFDPYTTQIFLDDDKMDIDHIVPLNESYKSGSFAWTREERKAFANDRENLIAVSLSANRSKGDQDPAKWMSPNSDFACHYLQAWVYLKAKYSLTVDQGERTFISDQLNNC